jgi:tRNA pseudouridine32 synthase/23S rRNA pseudouridine746 synthase
MTPEEIVARLLYRDALMLVIDKPAGMAVHRGPKGGESLEDHFDALRFGLPRAPALAHRLDRDTSGCLALGRHRKALAELGRLFKLGAIGKTYWAVVEGGPPADAGRIELALGRKDITRGWWMKPDPDGQPATTAWKVMGRSAPPGAVNLNGNLTWLALEPLTGRTHQLRVHCAAMGWPIVGDPIYGQASRPKRRDPEVPGAGAAGPSAQGPGAGAPSAGAPGAGAPGLQLHARAIVVPLYRKREPIRVTAPVPPHMEKLLQACGWREETLAPVA